MLKLQSLRWYLTGRSLFYPMIARLILLTPEKVERILAGEYPGISISHDFQRILEKELHYSNTQFEAAQYRRLELQAAVAGCSVSAVSSWPGWSSRQGEDRRRAHCERAPGIHRFRPLA